MLCEACSGKGYLEAEPDCHKSPAGFVYVQRCDACEEYCSDLEASFHHPGGFSHEDSYGPLCFRSSGAQSSASF